MANEHYNEECLITNQLESHYSCTVYNAYCNNYRVTMAMTPHNLPVTSHFGCQTLILLSKNKLVNYHRFHIHTLMSIKFLVWCGSALIGKIDFTFWFFMFRFGFEEFGFFFYFNTLISIVFIVLLLRFYTRMNSNL